MRQLYLIVVIATMTMTAPFLVQASEKDELAQIMRQLDQVQTGLDRAQALTATVGDGQQRFYFDYSRARADINAVKQGVSAYLQPSRAQPQLAADDPDLSGQYQLERAER